MSKYDIFGMSKYATGIPFLSMKSTTVIESYIACVTQFFSGNISSCSDSWYKTFDTKHYKGYLYETAHMKLEENLVRQRGSSCG